MRILDFQPVQAGPVVAHFSVELSPDLKLLHWQLHRNSSGKFRTFPPHVIGPPERRGRSTALAVHLAEQITAAATTEFLGGPTPHDDHNAV